MPKKLLLIDIDDTICNASDAYNIALLKCYKFIKEKYPVINKELFFNTYHKAREQIHLELDGTASMHNRFLYFQRLFEILGLKLDPRFLDEITKTYWDNVYKNLKLYKNVKKTLKIIKENNIKIGVVSDLIANIQIKKLIKLGIAKYIDFIVTSEESGKEKPHPSIFLMALKKANCLPSDAILVGDSIKKDIIGANNVGITPILFSKKKIKCDVSNYQINDFKELLRILHIKEKKFTNQKMLIFDMMGCIFSEGHIIRNVLLKLINKNGIKMNYSKLKRIYLDYSLGKISPIEFNKIIPEEIEIEFLNSLKLNSGLFDILKFFRKKHYKFGILSNIPQKWGNYLVKKFKLNEWFSKIVFSGTYKTRKPNEKLYEIFINNLNIKPENCYLLDDKLINLREARFFLMKTIWMRKEKQQITFVPDLIINRLNDLKKVLD